jgi:hypothetical protein
MIEAEGIFIVLVNIYFLCASFCFRSGGVGVTQWERCSVERCSVERCSVVERCSAQGGFVNQP